MSYETKKYVVTGKAANVRKFPDSNSGSLVTTLIQGDIVDVDISGTYTNTRGGSTTVYLHVVWDGVRRWAASGNFAEYNDTPLGVAAVEAPMVYAQAIGCKHVSGSYSWAAAMEQRQVNCAIVASRVACLAGLLEDGTLISHKTAVKTNILSQKGTISKAMSGYNNLDLDKCSVKWVGKTYSNLSSKYKVPGAIYIYDSNVAVCGKDGVIYSCNNGSNQLSNGVYVKNAMTSGYCFSSNLTQRLKGEFLMIYLITCAFIALDFITGLIHSFATQTFSSSIMRQGLFHKLGLLLCMALGVLVDYAQTWLELGVNVPVAGAVCAYIVIMEIVSIG